MSGDIDWSISFISSPAAVRAERQSTTLLSAMALKALN